MSLSPDLTGYQMGTRASDDVTGRDGAFSVSQIPFAKDPQTGNLIQLNPLRFTRAGWRPVVWRYDPPNGSENVDIRGVTVEMVQLDYYRGVITGLLVRDGQPAVAVPVGLGTLDQTGDKAGAGMVGWVETTDVFGRFIIGGLPPGTYILQPGYALGDGVFYPSQPAGGPVTIGDRDVIDVGTLELWHEIVPRDPPHGAELAAAPAALNWSAVPGALSYQVRFDRTVLPVTGTNAITLPDSLVIAPGLHYWSVLAGGETGGLVGSTQIQAVFRYSPPD